MHRASRPRQASCGKGHERHEEDRVQQRNGQQLSGRRRAKGNEGNGADNERGRREEDEVPPPADSPDQELAEELA